MNLINKIQVLIFDIINDNDFNKLSNLKPDDISIELSKSSKHGDLSTNIAMVLAKKLKTKPKDVALNLQKQIEKKFSNLYPDIWTPLYSMVSFSNIEYSKAWKIGLKQEEVMQTIMKIPNIEKVWKENQIMEKIKSLIIQ